MGGNPAEESNRIAQASLAESKRQYNETKAREDAQKAAARANALGMRTSGNMAYSNMFQQSTDYTTGADGGGYSLLTSAGTPSTIGTLLGGSRTTLG